MSKLKAEPENHSQTAGHGQAKSKATSKAVNHSQARKLGRQYQAEPKIKRRASVSLSQNQFSPHDWQIARQMYE